MELYRKHRPVALDEVIGQKPVVDAINDYVDSDRIPHALLLAGPSGTGKTTVARILKKVLGCSGNDFCEINAADTRGIETVREIKQRMALAPMQGKARIWLLDEAHKLTADAQTGLLKMLEDPPKHVYFILCTTEPDRVILTVRNRCSRLTFKRLSHKNLEDLVNKTAKAEGKTFSEEVVSKIAAEADGSARRALVILDQVMEIEDEEDLLEAIEKTDGKKQAVELARVLKDPHSKWNDVAACIKKCDEEPETIRRAVLGYCSAIALNSAVPSKRIVNILNQFEANFFDSGRGGLVRACLRVIDK